MKYLTDRYNRGRARVAELMQDSQRYVAVRELDEALPDILKVIQKPQKAAAHLVRSRLRLRPRHVILLLDLTVWPTRDLPSFAFSLAT